MTKSVTASARKCYLAFVYIARGLVFNSFMKRLWIGTSGYSYKHWGNGVFYPKGLPSDQWLEYYVQHFDTVELNVTFYRLPQAGIFRQWYKRVPADFRFVVKGSRYITHLKRLNDPAPAIRKFFQPVKFLKEKLTCVLWQLPPGFKSDLKRLEFFFEGAKEIASRPAPRFICQAALVSEGNPFYICAPPWPGY